MAKEKLIIALDVDSSEQALQLVHQLHAHVGVFKVGMELFNAAGSEVIQAIHNIGGKVFLDLKLHDIPTTVARTCRVLTRYKVAIINIHASGGLAMMQAAASAVHDEAAMLGIEPPLVIAVTVLTSMDQGVLNCQLNIPGTVKEQVVHWAKLAQQAGLDGVVASPQEITAIREECGDIFNILTPGIRQIGIAKNDQERVMTPAEAIAQGATYLVIGRPVTGAENPATVAQAIIVEISEIKGRAQTC
ncbi:MAG: orotidine-5'-phosphate decarboxylase [Desulfotomaculum sp.]|nr:orotidine-5'-phosphate decarboxylase [Desulfotomaculum sp.]